MDNEAITKNDLRAILDQLGMPFTPLDYYPIGAYFETSDSAFDPNTVWGGTWVLETSGYVHVSGDASGTSSPSYPVSKANNNSGAGASDGGASTVTLGATQIPNHQHSNSIVGIWVKGQSGYGGFTGSRWNSIGVTGTSYEDYGPGTFNSGNKTGTSGQSHENMQPYINVYRWHRTA